MSKHTDPPPITKDSIVFLVRSTDKFGTVRTVHAYPTEAAAQNAIVQMQNKTRLRYDYVKIKNRPEEHWGINDPVKKAP